MKVIVLGAGSWGVALSNLLKENGNEVTLWTPLKSEAVMLREEREHKVKLPGIKINEDIEITTDTCDIKEKEIIVFAVPSNFVRQTAESISDIINKDQVIVNVAKGIENKTFMTLKEVICDEIKGAKVAVLSGPSHAEEVARKIPTTVLAASEDENIVSLVQDVFMNDYFRIYGSKDVKGVEVGAALKNVIALAAGIIDGIGYGDNTKAALMTRGLAEIKRLGVALGSDEKTFYGLSGIGDLIVTCTSMNSRNRRCGILLGKGYSIKDAMEEIKMVVEGVYAAEAGYHLSEKYQISMPIITAVYGVLYHNLDPKEAINTLMRRERKYED